MGTFSDLVPLSNTTEGRDTYTRKVFAIQVHDVDPSLFSGQAFSVDLGTVREAMNGTDQEIGEQYLLSTMEALANATASIQVTPSILGRSSNKRHLVEQERISYDVFLTDSLFQTNNDRYVTASIIMGTRVRLQTDEGRTEAKITTTFQTEEVKVVCVTKYRNGTQKAHCCITLALHGGWSCSFLCLFMACLF